MATRTDEDKLRILLPHWIEHNSEHAEEFRQWAERVRLSGHEETANKIMTAASQLTQVNETLAIALEELG